MDHNHGGEHDRDDPHQPAKQRVDRRPVDEQQWMHRSLSSPPAQPNPLHVNLYDNLERLKLTVDQILPIHGRKVPLSELQKWIGKSS